MIMLWTRRCSGVVLLFVAVLSGLPAAGQSSARARLVFCCKPDNDLYSLLSAQGGKWQRFNQAMEAVRYAPQGTGVLILADGYPDAPSDVAPEIYDQAKFRGLRVYVEYPESFPGMVVDEPKPAE